MILLIRSLLFLLSLTLFPVSIQASLWNNRLFPRSNHKHLQNDPTLPTVQLDDVQKDLNTYLIRNVTTIVSQKAYTLDLYAGNYSSTYNMTFSYYTNGSPFSDVNSVSNSSLAYTADGTPSTSTSVTTLYFSANLCAAPLGDSQGSAQDNVVGTLFFDNETMTFPVSFHNGYASAKILLKSMKYVQTRSLYFTLAFNNLYGEYNSSTDYFSVSFGISNEGYMFKNQLKKGGYIRYLDSDSSSVLFEAKNSSYLGASDPSMNRILSGSSDYKLKIFEEEELTQAQYYNASVCYFDNLASKYHIDHAEHFTEQLNQSVSRTTKVSNLTAETQYRAYYIYIDDNTSYQIINIIPFSTQTEGICQLVDDMSFCSNVRYSIPQSKKFQEDGNYQDFINSYDNYARDVYNNFTLALGLDGCQLPDDQIYSPITSCQECSEAYKNWLCAVLIPRCDSTIATNSTISRVERTSLRSQVLSESVEVPSSYYETLPCIDLCFTIVRNCPSDFGFSCPKMMRDIENNYGFMNAANQNDGNGVGVGCNFVGEMFYSESIKPIGDYDVYGE
ncbi:hypothetical protein WICPIJ_006895 [Wickerhamomyces pijperi]|uniref:Stretch-activated cation channel MID1 n=1 Tax=Wickerhamomyces pijperi TaxID=599730 RepID=A0A9P8Q2Y9_WICPI|nr:hypothetical protein WICPIJ_006895 [Wickerhamomyces pijperi]